MIRMPLSNTLAGSDATPYLVAMASPEIEALTQALARLPGLGPRSARRAVLHLLKKRDAALGPLREALTAVDERLENCSTCGNVDTTNPCAICADPRRDQRSLCVVEEAQDVIPIERTHEFRGRYHVLGGALSPIDGVEPEDLRLAQLYARMDGVREVVLATNPTTTGEATAMHIAAALHERVPDVAVTRLASGLPVGGDLEYADEVTLGRAFAGRRAL